jgi:hypothetical protein
MQKSRFAALTICALGCLLVMPGATLAQPITLTVSNAANYKLRPGENSPLSPPEQRDLPLTVRSANEPA